MAIRRPWRAIAIAVTALMVLFLPAWCPDDETIRGQAPAAVVTK